MTNSRGLPPLARGAPAGTPPHDQQPGPTPACAGSTEAHRNDRPRRPAYPRLRGEHNSAPETILHMRGLPPLARGARCGVRHGEPWRGPTPACAGSTSAPTTMPACRRAYPRLRGEHSGMVEAAYVAHGLPPLARGAPRLGDASARAGRPTPACAGSTSSAPSFWSPSRAYPRLRGEHEHEANEACGGLGLPPLARGARLTCGTAYSFSGPTPACAGSTRSRCHPISCE